MATEAQPTVMAACRLESEESLQRCQKILQKTNFIHCDFISSGLLASTVSQSIHHLFSRIWFLGLFRVKKSEIFVIPMVHIV